MRFIYWGACICLLSACITWSEHTQTLSKKSMDNTIQHKANVLAFYQKVIAEGEMALVDSLIAVDYIQHNPQVKTGRAGIKEALAFLQQMPKPENPPTPFRIILGEGELVGVYMEVEVMGQAKAVMEIFRFEAGLLAEHWDAIQDRPQLQTPTKMSLDAAQSQVNPDSKSTHQKLVAAYYEKVLLVSDFENIADFASQDIRLHEESEQHGIESLKSAMEKRQYESLHRVVSEGDFVLAQARGIIDEKAHVFYDLYRLKNGKIEEHWAVSQAIPEIMAHENGMI